LGAPANLLNRTRAKQDDREFPGYDQVGDVPDYPAVFLSDGTIMITLWQATDPASSVPFDRKNVIGLHHLALNVDADAIDGLCDQLKDTTGVEIEFEKGDLLYLTCSAKIIWDSEECRAFAGAAGSW
jgi:hypothetical protein